nr:UDP galactose transporter [Hymenolepis microstoma]
MEKDTRVPETRVKIDQHFISDDLNLSQSAIPDTEIRISIDKFGSLNQFVPDVHNNSSAYNTFPRGQHVATSTPILTYSTLQQPTSKDRSQSSTYLSPMSNANGVSTPALSSRSRVETALAPYFQKPLVNGKETNHHSQIPQERAASPDELTCDSGLDDLSIVEEDRLRLHAACLEGRLSVYGREAETWLKERAELSTEAATLRKRLEVAKSTLSEVKTQSDQRIAEALTKSREARESLRQAQEQLTLKTRENEQLSANLTAMQRDSISLKSQLADVQQNSVAKDQALVSLREKMSELYADMESIRMAYSQALDHKTDLNAELASLRRSQEWYREQLQLTEAARDRLMDQLTSMRNWLDQSGTSAQQLAQENARLETQIMSGEAVLAEAKRNLTHELEAIRADILEREAIFEKIVAERSDLESLCKQKTHQINECQNRISALQADLNETEIELSGLRTSLDHIQHILQCAENERDNLRMTVSGLEAQLSQQKSLFDQQVTQYKQVCSKLTCLEASNYEQSTALNRALEEKASLEGSLQATYKEKATLDACLNQLREDMSRVESNFNALQSELDSRNSELSNVLLIRDELSNDIGVLQSNLQEKSAKVKELEAEREQLQNTSLTLQSENEGLRDDIKRLEESIGPACEEAANKAREPLITEVERLNNQSTQLLSELSGLREQISSLLTVQERYCALMQSHQTLQEQYDTLQANHTASIEEANAKQSELSQRLLEVETSYSYSLASKTSEIDSLTQQLNEKTNETLALQAEIALKIAHQQAYDQQSAEWAQRLSALESHLKSAETQRAEIQQQLQAVLEREHDTNIKQQGELKILRAEVAKLESLVAKSEGLENKYRQLMHELEASKGRELGLSDTVDSLKRHTAGLETSLSQREAEIVELTEKFEAMPMSRVDSEPIIQSVVQQELTTAPVSLPCSNCQMLTAEVTMYSRNVTQMQDEQAKLQAALELTKQELAAQSAKTTNEAYGRQQALEAQRTAMKEAERLRRELTETQQALSEAKHIASTAQANVTSLTGHLKSGDKSTDREVRTLKDTIAVLKKHLEQLKRELTDTKQESWHYQAHLSDLRGSLRGLIEQSRLFGSSNDGSTVNGLNSNGVPQTPASINVVEVSELEKLLIDRTDDSLLHSRPLVRVNNYLDRLQQEINSLESQVIHHANVVRDSVANWRSIEEGAVLIRTGYHPVPQMPRQ